MRLGILTRYVLVAPLVASTLIACTRAREDRIVVTFPGSSVGAEAEVLRRQLDDFMLAHPEIRVVQRQTPDAADQRHQLYVQWLNAGADDPDILQLDVVWIAEFAAAGWIRALDDFAPEIGDFFPATIVANRWQGRLYALPWFVDVGMLYWRTDLLPHAPATFEELSDQVLQARAQGSGFPQPHYGLVWQGARYEGLVTVFLEYLGAFGGRIVDESGRVIVDSPAARRALETMRAALNEGVVPTVALTWHEEESRLAFQNGQALLMRNWPYAYSAMQGAGSKVAGRFAIAPMPGGSGGAPTAALGGAQLAINAHSDQPRAAYAVIQFLTAPERMIERARVAGQYPARRSLYAGSVLQEALPVEPAAVRRIIEAAVPRPVTPVYSELSALLQIHLHQALIGERAPAEALAAAAREMRALLARVELGGLDAQ